jgi:type IV pilus assembly protein PilA
MFNRFHNRKGFTLIELMIVVVIIGILAALAIPRFMQATTKSKQSEAKQILKQIYTMQRAYRQETGNYAHNGDTRAAGTVFADLGVEIGANAQYSYVMTADNNTFSCTATVNLDDDAAVDSWTIDQAGDLSTDCDDVIEVAACA